jgi:hypothetical protein
MSDNDVNTPLPPTEPTPDPISPTVGDLVNELKKVDINSPEASLNATSISDNNGGRIDLTEKPMSQKRNIKW